MAAGDSELRVPAALRGEVGEILAITDRFDRYPGTGESRFRRRQIVFTGAARVLLATDDEQSPGMSVLSTITRIPQL